MGRFDQTPYTDVGDLRRHREANARNRGLPKGSLTDIIENKPLPSRMHPASHYKIESGEADYTAAAAQRAALKKRRRGRGAD